MITIRKSLRLIEVVERIDCTKVTKTTTKVISDEVLSEENYRDNKTTYVYKTFMPDD